MAEATDLCPSCDPAEEAERLDGVYADALGDLKRQIDRILERDGAPDELYGEASVEYNERTEHPELHLEVLEDGRAEHPVWSGWYDLPRGGLEAWFQRLKMGRTSTSEPPIHWVDDLESSMHVGEYAEEEEPPSGDPFYCAICGVESERPHDHSDDSPEPLVPPWRLER